MAKTPAKGNAAMSASKKAAAYGAKGKASGSAKQQEQLSARAKAIELRKRGRK
jgi:hypothetical protein